MSASKTDSASTDNIPAAIPIAVRELAEYIHRAGDIHVRFEKSTTGAEGIATQKRVQASRDDLASGYVAEHSVATEFAVGAETWRLGGRIDGCNIGTALVEEYKTTRADIDKMHAYNGHVHRAQLLLYGGILAREHPDTPEWQLDLCYCHPEQDTVVRRIGELATRAELIEFLETTIDAWRKRLLALYSYRHQRNERLERLPFPFATFRPNQRALAGRIYKSLTSGHNLLLEAATGTGKSLATLFPAYRALTSDPLNRIFFLTGRTTGQDAAQQAARQLHEKANLRTVTIIAREKACLVPGMPCDPEGCDYARGYYDKLEGALAEGLALGHTTPADIERIAQDHAVCPFELSLDLAIWMDLVVMDYNYLFDPVVRLQRFTQSPDAVVLIDEAHQLEPRVRDMLSVTVPKRQINAVLAPEADTPESVRKLATTLRRSFSRAAKQLFAGQATASQANGRSTDNRSSWGDVQIRPPKAFTERAAELVSGIAELADDTPLSQPVTDLFFSVLRWQRAQEWLRIADNVVADASEETQEVATNAAAFYDNNSKELRLLCMDASQHIAGTLANFGPNAQFSGTLSPLTLYQRLHGDPDTELARVSPGDLTDRLGLFVVPDISTYFRSREVTLPRLIELVRAVTQAKQGNYFAAFPSFAYLNQFADAYALVYPDQPLLTQRPGSDLADREKFVGHFRAAQTPTLGCVVLGGVFTESLDFADDALLGVIVISVALPPPDTARDALAKHFASTDEPGFGQVVAYQQPAMVRVVQAAGRVVRNETDRGIVCLVDARFQRPEFTRLQPPHWQPEVVRSGQIVGSLNRFWALGPDSFAKPD